ncbi:hypothetical protein AAGT95_19570 [Salinicola lusitanus]|uniref:Uncharacterized protein n=1 Tax=Salinicola lusitanus TaxID=1949085 RepID=A0ABZ3CS33_9GAMM
MANGALQVNPTQTLQQQVTDQQVLAAEDVGRRERTIGEAREELLDLPIMRRVRGGVEVADRSLRRRLPKGAGERLDDLFPGGLRPCRQVGCSKRYRFDWLVRTPAMVRSRVSGREQSVSVDRYIIERSESREIPFPRKRPRTFASTDPIRR